MNVQKESELPIWRKFSVYIASILFIVVVFALFTEMDRGNFTGVEESRTIYTGIITLAIAILNILFYTLGAYGKAKWPEKSYSNDYMLLLGSLLTPMTVITLTSLIFVAFTMLKGGNITRPLSKLVIGEKLV